MVTCPVCEHTQAQGDECENCGKQLRAARAVEVPVVRMVELEATAVAARGLRVQAAPLEELERTKLPSGPELPAQSMADVEPTRGAPVGRVEVQGLPDLDLGRSQDDGVRTVLPVGQVVCRYCRNVQAGGLLCERCGMRLPVVPRALAAAPPRAGEEEGQVRCQECGSRAHAGRRCGNCGVLVAGGAP